MTGQAAGPATSNAELARELEERGFAILQHGLTEDEVSGLVEVIESSTALWQGASVRRRSEVFAIRNLLEVVPEVAAAFRSPSIRAALRSTVGATPHLTRAILFDKTASANWHVSWHQDLSVAVKARHPIAGWEAWSLKADVHHVQPPAEILERMVTLRMHLDPCQIEHGPLRVIPESHRLGRLTETHVRELTSTVAPVTCTVAAGGLLLFKPLLIHASSAAASVEHRRVLHIEFSPTPAPAPLEWRYGPIDVAQA